MNLISIVLLAIVIIAFVWVARFYFFGHHRHKSCCDVGDGKKTCNCGCGGSCSGCSGCSLCH